MKNNFWGDTQLLSRKMNFRASYVFFSDIVHLTNTFFMLGLTNCTFCIFSIISYYLFVLQKYTLFFLKITFLRKHEVFVGKLSFEFCTFFRLILCILQIQFLRLVLRIIHLSFVLHYLLVFFSFGSNFCVSYFFV